MRIAQLIEKTEVEGPKIRTAIWLQGCSLNCPGCCNPEFFDSSKGNYYKPENLAIYCSDIDETEGITILGGEPLQQVEELNLFLHEFKKVSSKGIILFTGYQWKTVLENSKMYDTVNLCDLVISGPFIKKYMPDNRKWIGSTNQEVNFITDRYKYLEVNWPIHKKEIEIRIKDGEIIINGDPFDEKFVNSEI